MNFKDLDFKNQTQEIDFWKNENLISQNLVFKDFSVEKRKMFEGLEFNKNNFR